MAPQVPRARSRPATLGGASRPAWGYEPAIGTYELHSPGDGGPARWAAYSPASLSQSILQPRHERHTRNPELQAQIDQMSDSLDRVQVAAHALQKATGKVPEPMVLRSDLEIELQERGTQVASLSLTVQALVQSLAGLGGTAFNWSAGLGTPRRKGLAELILQYLSPLAHIDSSLEDLVADLKVELQRERLDDAVRPGQDWFLPRDGRSPAPRGHSPEKGRFRLKGAVQGSLKAWKDGEEDEKDTLWAKIDTNEDGVISKKEFKKVAKQGLVSEDVKFKNIDVDKDGLITRQEIESAQDRGLLPEDHVEGNDFLAFNHKDLSHQSSPHSPHKKPAQKAIQASVFCAECGTKFHEDTETFCSECGVPRSFEQHQDSSSPGKSLGKINKDRNWEHEWKSAESGVAQRQVFQRNYVERKKAKAAEATPATAQSKKTKQGDIVVEILGAKSLRDEAGKLNVRCTAEVVGQPEHWVRTKVVDSDMRGNVRWGNTFTVSDVNMSVDANLKFDVEDQEGNAMGRAVLEYWEFFPNPFHGMIPLQEAASNAVLEVKASVPDAVDDDERG